MFTISVLFWDVLYS